MESILLPQNRSGKDTFSTTLSAYWAIVSLVLFLLVAYLMRSGLTDPYTFSPWALEGLLLAGCLIFTGISVIPLIQKRLPRSSGRISATWPKAARPFPVKVCGCQGQTVSKVGNTYRCDVCGRMQ